MRYLRKSSIVFKVLFLFPTAVCQLNIINTGRCWEARQIGIAIKIGIPFP